MPRALVPCLTIVAAFQLHVAAAAPTYEDVPLPPAVVSTARAAGLDPASDGARFFSEFIRIVYAPAPGRNPSAAALEASLIETAPVDADAPSVPVPLNAALWSERIFRRPVSAPQLFHAIVSDRRAALLAYGLAGLDEATLSFFVDQPALLATIYEQSAPILAAFSDSLRVRDGRVVVPGGDAAAPLWTAAVGEPPTSAGAFVVALLGQHEGRLAYLFDLIASVERERAAFALGLWIEDERLRVARFTALVNVVIGAYSEWRAREQPFARPINDLTMLLMRIRVDDRGVPAGPASRAFWSAVFASDDPFAPAPDFDRAGGGVVDAAWLADRTSYQTSFLRAERLDQFEFGQRVFGNVEPGERGDALAALRAFPIHRMLFLTLERMGIVSPRVHAETVRQVTRLADLDTSRAFWALAQVQGSLAMLNRMRAVGTLDQATATRLVGTLVELPLTDGRIGPAMAGWIERELLPLLPPSLRPEGRLLAGLAGPRNRAAPVVTWEGDEYRVDFAAAELERLRLVREKQGGYSVDLALALLDAVRPLSSRPDAADLRAVADSIRTADLEFARELNRAPPDVLARNVDRPRDARAAMAGAVTLLAEAASRNDLVGGRRVAAQIGDVIDSVLGEALLSIAYAVDLGDPGGTALLGRNVAMRHDFGLSRPDSSQRKRLPWALPRQEFRPGVPWHVTGSLLGLDVALAPLALQRLSAELPREAPALLSIEREAFAISRALLDARRLRDADRDAIAQAVARGRAAVSALAPGDEAGLERLTGTLGLTPRRQQEIRWALGRQPASVLSQFALVELVDLGGGVSPSALDAWGAGALVSSNCLCTRAIPTRFWRIFEGRPQVGFGAGTVTDLNLQMAVMLHDLRVPAPLAKPVLAAAVLEFIESVTPLHINDWRSLSRAAQAVPRERVEDYVAATAAVGGPLIPATDESARQP